MAVVFEGSYTSLSANGVTAGVINTVRNVASQFTALSNDSATKRSGTDKTPNCLIIRFSNLFSSFQIQSF
ncbi:hypothetical protein [Lysinibacillus fusiformis]|nr:hypothetical protein [Lysinibacillus fusiformis]